MMRVFRPAVSTVARPHGVYAPRDGWHSTGSSPRLLTLPAPAPATFAPPGSIALLLTVAGDALHLHLAEALAHSSARARDVLDARQKAGREATAWPEHVAELCYAGEPWMTGLVLDAGTDFAWRVQDFPGAALEAAKLSLRSHCAQAGFTLEASVVLTPPAMNDLESLAQQQFPPLAPTAGQPWLRWQQGR